MDREHDLSGKVMQAGSKAVHTASAINDQYKISDKAGGWQLKWSGQVSKGVHAAMAKAQEVEEKHHVSSKAWKI